MFAAWTVFGRTAPSQAEAVKPRHVSQQELARPPWSKTAFNS